MLRSQVLSKSTFRGCQSCSMWLRCVRRSSPRSPRTSFSSPRRASCFFPDRPVEPLIRLEDKIRDEIRHRIDSLPRARGAIRQVRVRCDQPLRKLSLKLSLRAPILEVATASRIATADSFRNKPVFQAPPSDQRADQSAPSQRDAQKIS